MATIDSIVLSDYSFEGVLRAGAALAQIEKDAGRLTGDQYSSFLLGVFQSAVQAPVNKTQMDLNNTQMDLNNTQKTIANTQSAADAAVKEAQKNLVVRQKSAIDDAVKKDLAKIVCEMLGIIKSGGNSAGAWWDVASQAVNNLAGFNIANVSTDPTP